jgi:pyruvate formate lyase activating enzyme
MIERKALIFGVQKYNPYDGPGVRTLIFFKGCPLRCKWCSNPEGFERKTQVIFKRDLCTLCGACVEVCPVGIHRVEGDTHTVDRLKDCLGCRKCVGACVSAALSIAGEYKTVGELFKIVMEDKAFYDQSRGGVTLGGGEVTMQSEAAASLLAACKQNGVNTAIETSGYTKTEHILRLAEFTDLFLFDIKHFVSEDHQKLTGVRNELILDNLKRLIVDRRNVRIRMPLLEGINTDEAVIEATAAFLAPYAEYKNFKGIDLLPYHRLGKNKYSQLDLAYYFEADPVMSEETLQRIAGQFKARGLTVSIIRH